MSDESNLSKRERQKARRDAKVRAERAQAARARRIRLGVFVLIGAVVAGLAGVAVAAQVRQRQQLDERRAAVQAKLDAVGCGEEVTMDDLGSEHIDSPQQAASAPPEQVYPDRPGTSGPHYGQWLKTGVYDQRIDERVLVHNLEHGYVVAYHDGDAPAEQVDELEAYAREQIDGDFPKIVVAPWDGELPEDANFAYTAWTRRQLCRDFDTETFRLFLDEHHSGNGVAPEKTLPPHLEEGAGTIDPGKEDLLLPPLGQASGDAPRTPGAPRTPEASEAGS